MVCWTVRRVYCLNIFQENEDPGAHGVHVWNNFVAKSAAKRVAIVAHSAGGIVTTEMVSTWPQPVSPHTCIKFVMLVCF